MRALSPHAGYGLQLFGAEEKLVIDGTTGTAHRETVKQPICADFEPSGLLDHEIEAALESFTFTGVPEGVSPLSRIGVFDSEAYVQRFPADQRDALLVQVNTRLEELAPIFPSQFIIVPHPKAERPWPSYDEMAAEEILNFQKALRFSPEKIRIYEMENKERAEIIDAMEAIERKVAGVPEEATPVEA